MLRPCVEIQIKTTSGHCGGCGSYTQSRADILFPGGHTLRLEHDGHGGRGDWNGEEAQLRLLVLGLMGVVPTINGVETEMPRLDGTRVHLLTTPIRSGFYDQLPIDLEMSEVEDSYGDRHDASIARWASPDELHSFEMGSTRGDDDLWIAVSDSLIDFEIESETDGVASTDSEAGEDNFDPFSDDDDDFGYDD